MPKRSGAFRKWEGGGGGGLALFIQVLDTVLPVITDDLFLPDKLNVTNHYKKNIYRKACIDNKS